MMIRVMLMGSVVEPYVNTSERGFPAVEAHVVSGDYNISLVWARPEDVPVCPGAGEVVWAVGNLDVQIKETDGKPQVELSVLDAKLIDFDDEGEALERFGRGLDTQPLPVT